MAGNVAWFANNAYLQMDGIGVIAALKGVTIEPKFEIVELYGMEDLRVAARARHSLKVAITVKYAKWDAANDTIMNQVVGTDFTSATKNVPALFTMHATFNSIPATSGETIQHTAMTVEDIVFEGVPWNLTENEFIVRELTGTGRTVTVIST